MVNVYISCAYKDYSINGLFEGYIIKKLYPDQDITLINPKNVVIDDEDKQSRINDHMNRTEFKKYQMRILQKYFFPLIKTADVLVAFPNIIGIEEFEKTFNPCVKQEIRFAKFNHIEVIEVDYMFC